MSAQLSLPILWFCCLHGTVWSHGFPFVRAQIVFGPLGLLVGGTIAFLRDLADLFSRKSVPVLVGLEMLGYRQKSYLRDFNFNIEDVFLIALSTS